MFLQSMLDSGYMNFGPRYFRPGLSARSEIPVIFRPGPKILWAEILVSQMYCSTGIEYKVLKYKYGVHLLSTK